MDRRRFCQSTLYASLAASYPFIAACERVPPTADRARAGLSAVTLDGAEIEIEQAAVKELGEAIRGPVLLTGDAEYDSARALWNSMHDKRPARIARCLDSEDVSRAVTFAREHSLLTAVRGGGHSFSGKSVCDRGLMIDLSQMASVEVDAGRQSASAGGGALLGTLDAAALDNGMVTPAGVVSHTGVGGLTLGGGFGRLNRKFGLTIDNLESAELVTADGKIRTVSEERDADLFWAIRGGGGNFGVVTRFDFRLHAFERNVLGGGIVWPIDQAAEVLDFYGDWYAGLSDELYVAPFLMTTPDGDRILMMDVTYCGDPAVGEKEVAPLRAMGTPVNDGVALIDYYALQTQYDTAFGYGRRNYIKSGMAKEITPELLRTVRESFPEDPRIVFGTHTAGGAVNRVGELDTAFPHRNAQTLLVAVVIWQDAAEDDGAISSLRTFWRELEPHTGGYYTNLTDDADASAAGNYGPAYSRLSKIKAEYDPGNLFRLNSNVRPG